MSLQVVAKRYFEVERREYQAKTVITFNDVRVGEWVVKRGYADSDAAAVAAAIGAAALQVTHSPGAALNRRPLVAETAADGGVFVPGEGAAAVRVATGRGRRESAAMGFHNQLSGGLASAATATTYETLVSTLRKPVAVQLVYRHNRTAAHAAGAAAALRFMVGSCVAANASATNLAAVTWDGATSPASVAQAAATTVQQLVSDIIPVTSMPRNDASGYLLPVRCLVPVDASTGAFSYSNTTPGGAPISTAGARVCGTRQKVGDYVTVGQGGFDTVVMSSGIWFVDIVLYYEGDERSDVFMGVGDSITTGEFSTLLVDGWTRQTCALATADGFNLDYLNYGWGGQSSATYLAMGLAGLEIFRPRFASYSTYCGNEGSTAAIRKDQKTRALSFLDKCRALGVQPLMPTPTPRNNASAEMKAHLLDIRLWLQSYVRDTLGFKTPDLLQAMGDPADMCIYRAGFGAADGVGVIHPTQAGYSAGAAVAYADLTPML